jgi:type I restriction enzyme S subunit
MEKLQFNKGSWTPVNFGDVVSEVRNTVKNDEKENIERYVGLEHIDPENIHISKWGFVKDGTTFTRKFEKGQILFGRRRAYLKKAGLATFTGLCSGDIIVMEGKEKLLHELLPFLINNDDFFDFAVDTSAGSLSPRTKFKHLAEYQFLLPPTDQQAKIAELLWAMEDVVEKEKKVLESLISIKKTFQKELFYSENKENHTKLVNYASVQGGFAFKSKDFTNDGIPVIKIKNIVNGGIKVDDKSNYISVSNLDDYSKFILKTGDILIAMTGATLGKVGVVSEKYSKSLLNQRVGRIDVKNGVSDEFIFGYLESYYFKHELFKYIGEGAQGNVSPEDIVKIKVKKYMRDEMNNIGTKFISINKFLKNIYFKIQQSKQLQRSLINKIFSS